VYIDCGCAGDGWTTKTRGDAVTIAPETSATKGEPISLVSVGKVYAASPSAAPTLADITLDIRSGEFVALVGPSGCGKSTLLKIIAGLIPYESGVVSVGDSKPKEGRRDIGFMHQQSTLMPWLDVKQNVALPFRIARESGAHVDERVEELLELVGLSHAASMRTWELSGGMQQRVALARALALDPGVMLMDEPFSALDEFKREHLNIEVAHMSDTIGKTTILVTHSISEAVLMSDRVVALAANPGRVVADVSIGLERPRVSEMVSSRHFQELSNEVRDALADGLKGTAK
jgi:NitT/TauT family transport system ATP-binding protein